MRTTARNLKEEATIDYQWPDNHVPAVCPTGDNRGVSGRARQADRCHSKRLGVRPGPVCVEHQRKQPDSGIAILVAGDHCASQRDQMHAAGGHHYNIRRTSHPLSGRGGCPTAHGLAPAHPQALQETAFAGGTQRAHPLDSAARPGKISDRSPLQRPLTGTLQDSICAFGGDLSPRRASRWNLREFKRHLNVSWRAPRPAFSASQCRQSVNSTQT
jgi:hypothetical protein